MAPCCKAAGIFTSNENTLETKRRGKKQTLVTYRFSPKFSGPNAFYLPNTGNEE